VTEAEWLWRRGWTRTDDSAGTCAAPAPKPCAPDCLTREPLPPGKLGAVCTCGAATAQGDVPTWWHPLHGNLGQPDALAHERPAAAAEDRQAWDQYAAAYASMVGIDRNGVLVPMYDREQSAQLASHLLEQRRKRFGPLT